jgi:glycosyltransferase involved in cell wall biosynthesis
MDRASGYHVLLPMIRNNRRFLFLEPFYGGSHREFADGWREYSRFELDLHCLPARFWKWRMRGAALHFARRIDDPSAYSGLIVTDLISLADLKALWGRACPPTLLYIHENQLTYPLAPGERLDRQYGFTNLSTALCADRVIFNSNTHLRAFFEELPRFVNRMPEYRPRWVLDEIRDKSAVLYPGCRFSPEEPVDLPRGGESPLIVWNHRWEFDKNPARFFSSLRRVEEGGETFRLVLLGENYQKVPKAFIAARRRWGESILQYGYVPSREGYLDWLRRGSVVISTADQENFGISVVEAVRHGCFPLLPGHLSYPELIPGEFHHDVLFADQEELVHKLSGLLSDLRRARPKTLETISRLALSMNRYSWHNLIDSYDDELDRLSRIKSR